MIFEQKLSTTDVKWLYIKNGVVRSKIKTVEIPLIDNHSEKVET
jgi:hypothetical protein